MECVWTDYIGSTEDCWELAECYDGLYITNEVGVGTVFYNLAVDTEDEFYSTEEFTMAAESEIVLSIDQDFQLVSNLLLKIVTDTEDSTSFSIVEVVQNGDIYTHTLIFNFAVGGGVFESIEAIDGSDPFTVDVSGVKLPNGELRTICTPILFGISYS